MCSAWLCKRSAGTGLCPRSGRLGQTVQDCCRERRRSLLWQPRTATMNEDHVAASAAATPADDAAHILIIDDDRRIRELLSRMLSAEGYRVTTAGDSADASANLKSFAFDLIVLDVMMPGEDGFAFAARLRADSTDLAQVPILMLTARSETEDRVRGLEAGVDDYLSKPCEPRELCLRIASILRRATPRLSQRPPASVHFGEF